jgi:hypothetical protein
MKWRSLPLAAVVLAVALVSAAHATVPTHSAMRPQTTDPTAIVTIRVKITDARIALSRSSTARGNYVRFVVRNVGTKIHNFTLGKQTARGSGGQPRFTQTVKPRRQKILLIYLDYRGKLPYYTNIKADLNKPGMKGIFTIL